MMNTPSRLVFAWAGWLFALCAPLAEAGPWLAQWGPALEGNSVLLKDKLGKLSVTFPPGTAAVTSDPDAPEGKAFMLNDRLTAQVKAPNALPIMSRLYVAVKIKPVEADAKGFQSAIITGNRWELRYNMIHGTFSLVVTSRNDLHESYEVEVPAHLDTWNDIQFAIEATKMSLKVGKAECIRIIDGPSLTPFDKTSFNFFRAVSGHPTFVGGLADLCVAEAKP